VTGEVTNSLAPRSKSFTQTQPKISLTWDATDNLTLFGSWGIGFKSGGFNNLGAKETIQFFLVDAGAAFGTELVAPPEIFDKETSSAFELGFRARLNDGRVQLNGAIFQTDVDDMQFFEFFVGSFGLLRVVENIDEVSIKGYELGLTALLTDSLTFNAGYSKIDGEIDKFSIRPNTVGNDVPNAPEYTLNASLQFQHGMTANWDFLARVDYAYQGPTWYNTVQDKTVPATLFGGLPAAFDRSQVDGYGITNLRVGVESEHWRITAFAQNLTDEEYLAEVITAAEFGGSFVHPGAIRTAGLEVAYRF
jgi:iron complex outermembrane receptor protein